MEDRYELRGKIGQGGIGSVHRAYDHRMKREVAIKRILTSSEDPFLQEEATKQLLTEVSALASLQHPNIVTVYDVGADEQGPYIVMELITGKTLDEIAENAPLVWPDFKLIAMQSLEALIAAQELNLIHSDLKPPNIMLTWLPSGAFQVKIVDFGLATLIHNQSQEEIQKLEAVYGSIFFMPPEQYERKTLDTRSDLYSLGCCFYQALSGTYPFNGSTGMEVMEAHLNHTVKPIQEVRSDIPLWACHWVMWLINRYPDDRPPSARDALANFIQNDKETTPIMSRAGASGIHPRFIIPGPLPPPATGPVSTSPPTSTVPTAKIPTVVPYNPGRTGPIPTASIPQESTAPEKRKLPIKALIIALAIIAVLLLGGLGWLGIQKMNKKNQVKAFDSIASMAVRPNVKEIQINKAQLEVIFGYLTQSAANADIGSAITALVKAKATDKSNFDTAIAEFATTATLAGNIRTKLFEDVIRKRSSRDAMPTLLKFTANAKISNEGLAAFNAISRYVAEENSTELLDIIASTSHSEIRDAAVSEMTNIIERSSNQKNLAALISKTGGNTSVNASGRQALESLLKLCKP